MEYNFIEIERKWRKHWADNKTFAAEDNSVKPKYYVLDMFPYPSGAGLHVGHPLGYIASDIYARYKRLRGYNVLHPMGYDSFGLPAEQYAIQTGQHPAITTKQNIDRYRDQLDKIGFSFDWDREVRTSSPEYYKWTQWIFKQIFNSWYNLKTDRAENIDTLIAEFEANGNKNVEAVSEFTNLFTADEWSNFSEKEKSDILMEYRLAYLADSWVNWCPALGTVLANDEVINGLSERGGHPVEQKLMRQWSMRIKAYAERLLTGLETVDWTDAIKDMQRNWIGKSVGASVSFPLWRGTEGECISTSLDDPQIEVFTTRPDTIFGVSFMVLAPEHPLVDEITTADHRVAIEAYKTAASLKSERDRQADVKNITGQFTGAYAIHPFSGEKIPVWIGDYVLASYGTGAVMAVPCGDQRDYDFATHFGIPIKNIFENVDISEAAYTEKEGTITNSDFLTGLSVKEAMKVVIAKIEEQGLGKGKTNYRLRDAIFSRQRYWGEPFPVYYKNDIPYLVDDAHLPIELPEVDKYLPTEDGEPPLARAEKSAWKYSEGDRMEYNTMPGWAGSSFYFLRYMDPHNENEFVSNEKADYWNQVDLYIGGSEHATGHLLYSRFWCKFLYDRGFISFEEPFAKMINQGMILGRSSFVYRIPTKKKSILQKANAKFLDVFVSYNRLVEAQNDPEKRQALYKELEDLGVNYQETPEIANQRHVDISLVDNDKLDIESFKSKWNEDSDVKFIYEEDVRFGKQVTPLLMYIESSAFNNNKTAIDIEGSKELNEKYEDILPKVLISQSFYDEWLKGVLSFDNKEYYSQEKVIKDQILNLITEKNVEVYLDFNSMKNLDFELDVPYGEDYLTLVREKLNGESINCQFIFDQRKTNYICGSEVEKMSKSKFNVQTPDELVEKFGADTLRMYEMFLGPLEQTKPWDTKGISGVHNFLRKLWRLFYNEGQLIVTDEPANKESLKTLHKTIKKVEDDLERYAFNTNVSNLMICVNELTDQKCHSKAILKDLVILLAPYAPHAAEELWEALGNEAGSVSTTHFPKFNPDMLVEANVKYPVSFNGKMRFNAELPTTFTAKEVEEAVMAMEETQKWLEGKTPKKIIVVPGKIVNMVI